MDCFEWKHFTDSLELSTVLIKYLNKTNLNNENCLFIKLYSFISNLNKVGYQLEIGLATYNPQNALPSFIGLFKNSEVEVVLFIFTVFLAS